MIWFNGGFCDSAMPLFTGDERGLLLGEGIFETILWVDGAPQFWDAHMARFRAALDFFDMACLYDAATLYAAAGELVGAMGGAPHARFALRLTVSGGAGGRGLQPQAPPRNNWLMRVTRLAPRSKSEFIGVLLDDMPRNHKSPLVRYKTLSYFENILARRRALAAGGDEAIVLNSEGRLAGAAAANVFLLNGRKLSTPALSEGALGGIMRSHVLACADAAGYHIYEGALHPRQCATSDAILLTNVLMGIVPLTRLIVSLSQSAIEQGTAIDYDPRDDAVQSLISSTCRPR